MGDPSRKTLKPLIPPKHLFERWTTTAGVSLCSIFLLAAILLSLPVSTLYVREGMGEAQLAMIPVSPGSQLEVEYIHSMYGVLQNEIFSIGSDRVFHLEKVVFSSLAAALYYDPDPPGGLTFKDNVWIVKGNGKRYFTLTYLVSPGTDHILKVNHRNINLSNRSSGMNGLIQVGLEKRSRLSSLLNAFKESGFIP